MHAFDNTCQHIQNCNGCKDRYTFLKMYVNIFKTAMDVRIAIANMNVKITCQHIQNCNGCKDRYTFLKMFVTIFKTAMDVRMKYVCKNVRIT